jgi:hypothetical protein
MRRIGNVGKMEIAINRGRARADGRPAVSFHVPQFPFRIRVVAKSSLACTGIFRSNVAGECIPPHWQLPMSAMAEEREKLRFEFLSHVLYTHSNSFLRKRGAGPLQLG